MVDSTREFLVEGLTVLKNRGYDSAGLVTMANEPGSPLVRNIIVVIFLYHGGKKGILSLISFIQTRSLLNLLVLEIMQTV